MQACRLIAGNFPIKWTRLQVFFDSNLSPHHALPMYWLKPLPPSNFEELPPPPSGAGHSSPCSQHLWENLYSMPKIVVYNKVREAYSGGLQYPPPPTPQLQSLHHKVVLTWERMPKLNSCIILCILTPNDPYLS